MARPNKTGLSPAVVNHHLNSMNPETGKLWTQSDVARKYGVSRQYITYILVRYDQQRLTKREIAMEKAWPWQFPDNKYNSTNPCKRLRDHVEYMATGGKGMSDAKLRALRQFYKKLTRDNLVVEFQIDIPPNEAASTGGWAYRPRENSDGDLVIRVNGCTVLSEEALTYWTLPPVLPG